MTHRTSRVVLLVVGVLTVWLAVMTFIALQPERTEGNLGIDDQTRDGAGAITSVLHDHGITVLPAQSQTQLRADLRRHPEATVVFHDKFGALQTASIARLRQLADLVPADQRVFAGVSPALLPHLLDDVEHVGPVDYLEDIEPGCRLEVAREAGQISGARHGVQLRDTATGCFGVQDPMSPSEELYAFARTASGSIVFADWRMLSNAGLRDNGTATLATWSLGRTDTVIWFQPDFRLDPDSDGQLSAIQLPDWARMGLVWAVIVTVIFLLVRGRRTGPVITEPLPTEVSAAETTVGRGRLYARARQHHHALDHLQRATLARLARTLQLGAGATRETIMTETAQQLGIPLSAVHDYFAVPAHLTDHGLVTAAQNLQDLEHHVRDRFTAHPKEP